MNGDFIDRPLDQWFAETMPRCADQWPVHCRFLLEDNDKAESVMRAFAGSMRIDWWHAMVSGSSFVVSENRRLKAENEKLWKQNRNLRKRQRKS